jgi:hypothetical protein
MRGVRPRAAAWSGEVSTCHDVNGPGVVRIERVRQQWLEPL